MAIIILKDGRTTQVDDDIAQKWGHLPWAADKNGYVTCWLYKSRRWLVLSRVIMEPAPGFEVHHTDLDPLNNRRENLRCLSKAAHKYVHRQRYRKVESYVPLSPEEQGRARRAQRRRQQDPFLCDLGEWFAEKESLSKLQKRPSQ